MLTIPFCFKMSSKMFVLILCFEITVRSRMFFFLISTLHNMQIRKTRFKKNKALKFLIALIRLKMISSFKVKKVAIKIKRELNMTKSDLIRSSFPKDMDYFRIQLKSSLLSLLN